MVFCVVPQATNEVVSRVPCATNDEMREAVNAAEVNEDGCGFV